MKKTIFILAAISAAVSFALIACTNTSAKSESAVIISQDSMIKRGSYLVNAVGCDDCHSPKKMGPTGPEIDMEHRFSGHLANSPMGKPNTSVMKDGYVLFAIDLTSAVGP